PAKWNLGFSAYTPFGSGIKYADDWLGQFVLREMSLKIIFLQTTFGYQITEKLGIGVAHVYGFGNFYLRKGVPTANANGDFGEGVLEGSASGHGLNAGIYYQVSDKLSAGVSYRSSVTVKEEDGIATFSVPSSLKEFFPSTTFSTSISLPQVINFGLGYKLSEKTTLAYDFSTVGWSIYDSLIFDFAENTDKLEDIKSPRHYRNTMIFRLGVEHKVNDKFTVRGGAYYDMTPVEDGYITPETPGANKIGISAGASILITEHFNIDLSFLYLEGAPRTDTNLETGFGGTWKGKAYVPGFALEYLF
ncbi:MAG: outer membrane protein transport protein, partial [Flavobacteriales bacterium]|nr:outer membrane protein transport protein [Flavobacteriales bacterium]